PTVALPYPRASPHGVSPRGGYLTASPDTSDHPRRQADRLDWPTRLCPIVAEERGLISIGVPHGLAPSGHVPRRRPRAVLPRRQFRARPRADRGGEDRL